MKPDWDSLMSDYEGDSSVVIGDVDCTVEAELCGKMGVQGYPTIKYWNDDGDAQAYQGGRDLDSLTQFVVDNLAPGCTIEDQSPCSEKQVKYIAKWQQKSQADIEAQLDRLLGMSGGSMKAELRAWIKDRIVVLRQLQA
jgi:protein disulfide-isomerase A6